MAQRHYSSTAAAMQLQGPVSAAATSLTVDAVVGLPTSYPFTVVIGPGTELEEIVTVTNVAGTVLTVVRGEDGTSGASHPAGAVIRHMVTARDLREPQQHIEATSGVHGVAGPLAQLLPTGTTLPFLSAVAPSGFLLADGASRLRADDPDLFAVIGTTWGEGDDPGNTFALPNLVDRTVVGAGGDHSLGDTFGEAEVTLGVNHMPSHSHTGTAASSGAHAHTASTGSDGTHFHTAVTDALAQHTHDIPNARALLSPTDAGNFYTETISGPSRSLNNRIDGTLNGGSASRTNFVRVIGETDGATGSIGTVSVTSAGAHTHSVSVDSGGAHTHSVSTVAQGGGEAHNNMQPSAALYWIIKR